MRTRLVEWARDPGADVNRRRPPLTEFARYLRTETVGGMVLLGAAVIALVWANSPLADVYDAFRTLRFGPEALHLHLPMEAWAKDGLLALFFFVAGLELKRELVIGELADLRAAVLPVVAAVGGMVVPAVLAVVVGGSATGTSWAIPVATDIAFALAVLAITGSGLPGSARIFLLSLAVVDDLGAIALIAILYTDKVDWVAAVAVVVLLVIYWYAQRRRIRTPLLYVPLAVLTWGAVHAVGVHATLAGVALGLLTRVRADDGESEAPAARLEHRLQPWSAGFAVPVFALFAAGVPINARALAAVFTEPVPLAVLVGLVLGKAVGIAGFSYGAVKIGVARRPRDLGLRDIAAVAVLGGVGFTVSLLIAELSLQGAAADEAKAAVLIASAIAALLGSALLARRGRKHAAAIPE
jgi:NhaA family Na+:H+ antiporter